MWSILILVLCTLPGEKLPENGFHIPYLDKIVHFILFYVLGIFVCSELKFQTKFSSRKVAIITILLVSLYGALIELLQHYVFVYRSGEYLDLFADILGGFIGVLTYRGIKTIKDKMIAKKPLNKYPILKKIL